MKYHRLHKYDAVTYYELKCSECRKVVSGVIEFCEDDSYDTLYICAECLEKALAECKRAQSES